MRNYLPDMFDDFDVFDRDFFGRKNPLFGHHEKELMKTDIRDHTDHYEMMVDLPGFKKEDIQIQMNNGYLTINAEKGIDKKENGEDGSVIRQERYVGALSRSFYIGKDIDQKDIHAKLDGGVLEITVPKKVDQEETQSYIFIE